VTVLLIALNVAAFLIQRGVDLAFPEGGGVESYLALSRDGIAHGYYWQFVSYMFLHGGVLHLLFNCLGLYFAGREVEIICGPKHLLGMYFLGGILGGAAQLAVSETSLIGASGGVFAVLMAFATVLPELEITVLIFFVIPLRMRAKWLGAGLIGTSVFFALTGIGGDIGHIAHLGGALTGWVYARRLGYGGAFWLQRVFRDRRRLRERRARMGPTQFISEEIDPILDKISKEGIHSLTREERRVLELGRDKIARKTRMS
jgi:membrane associated rhomboid family serine protease